MTVRKPLANGDDGSGNRYPVREPLCGRWSCKRCNLQHTTEGCPSNPADVPDSWVAPKCAGCGARNWQVDHLDDDPDQPLMCGECAYQHSDLPL